MDNKHPQERAVAMEIAAVPTASTEGLISRLKAAMAGLSPHEILKLTWLGLGLVAWYPLYSNLAPFSLWITYDVFRIAPGTHRGDAVSFFFWIFPRSSCCWFW